MGTLKVRSDMARKPRIHFPGAFYHVMLRGNGGQDVFFSSEDRTRFYFLLQEGIGKYGHRIHAFCLMNNHIHLIIQVDVTPLSKIIQNLSFRYTRYINTIKNRTGHLFQGRYKAILIDADNYLLQLVRYIHNNPVRAKIVCQCKDFLWSSHNSYCGESYISWLTTSLVMSQFSDNLETARIQYIDFVDQVECEDKLTEFRNGTLGGRFLGDDCFAEKAIAKTEEKFQTRYTFKEIINVVCSEYEISPSALTKPGQRRDVSEARAVIALLSLDTEDLTLTNLAKIFRREPSGLSQAASRLQKKLLSDSDLAARVKSIKSLLKA